MMEAFLARQPIFDAQKNVYAYELLYRSGFSNTFSHINGDAASADVIITAFQTFGIETLTDGKPAFINFTETLINQAVATIIPRESLVIEILETVEASQTTIAMCQELKRQGYTLALDDFVYKPQFEPLMALADIIKIDFAASSRPEIEQLVNRVKQAPIRLLAEKIESNAEFDYARGLGFTLFQGYFFRRPEIVTAKRLTPLQSSFMQLLTKANQQPFDFDGLSQIISHDLSLVYSLLRLINSAAFGLRQKVTSIKQALVLLGEREIRKWISLLALQNISSGKPDELIRLSLIRARFIELIAVQTQCDDKTAAHCRQLSSEFFFAGLFSLLDVMLDRPLPVLLAEIEAPGIVKDCLLGKDPSAVTLYQLIIAYEQGRWNDVSYHADALSVDHSAIADAYIGALRWYRSLAA